MGPFILSEDSQRTLTVFYRCLQFPVEVCLSGSLAFLWPLTEGW